MAHYAYHGTDCVFFRKICPVSKLNNPTQKQQSTKHLIEANRAKMMVAFPAGSSSEKELEEAFINGEIPWTIQPNVARQNNEEWNKSFEAKSFANSFNRVKRQAAFRVQDLEEAKGKRK